MRLTKKTVLIAIASLAVLGLCLWGGSLYLTRQNALKRFDENFIHYQTKSDDHQTFIAQDIKRKEVYNLSYSPAKETIAITKTIKKGISILLITFTDQRKSMISNKLMVAIPSSLQHIQSSSTLERLQLRSLITKTVLKSPTLSYLLESLSLVKRTS